MPDKKSISIWNALCRVGQAQFGDQWLGEPTEDEDEVLESDPLEFRTFTIADGGREVVLDRAGAVRRNERRLRQFEWCERWLYQHCFTKKQREIWDNGPWQPVRSRGFGFRFGRAKFERQFAAAFSSADVLPNARKQPASAPAVDTRAWRVKHGATRLTKQEEAIFEEIKALWPTGGLDQGKAKVRNDRIKEWLKYKNSSASVRAIQRLIKKIEFH